MFVCKFKWNFGLNLWLTSSRLLKWLKCCDDNVNGECLIAMLMPCLFMLIKPLVFNCLPSINFLQILIRDTAIWQNQITVSKLCNCIIVKWTVFDLKNHSWSPLLLLSRHCFYQLLFSGVNHLWKQDTDHLISLSKQHLMWLQNKNKELLQLVCLL